MTSAAALRDVHRPGDPLVLVNVWDASSAKIVEAAGAKAIATTSAGLVESLGAEDNDSCDPDDVFAVIARVAGAVAVPVTADIEAGYQLPADELAERLLAAGAVGCNIEDSDHHRGAVLVDAEAHAARIRAIKDAALRAGRDLVINARTDAFVRRVPNALDEALARGALYREAGADCFYPIVLADEELIARVVETVGMPVNVLLQRGGPSIPRLAALGVARVSIGSGLYRRLERVATEAATALLQRGDADPLFG